MLEVYISGKGACAIIDSLSYIPKKVTYLKSRVLKLSVHVQLVFMPYSSRVSKFYSASLISQTEHLVHVSLKLAKSVR